MAKSKKYSKDRGEDKKKYGSRNTTSKEGRSDSKESKSRTNGNRGNDVAWYAANPQLLVDAGSLSYSNPVGSIIKQNFDTDNWVYVKGVPSLKNKSINEAYPGVCSLEIAPSVGVSTNLTSPINMAAKQFDAYVRHANSGAKVYDTPDLMLYNLSMDSAYSLWAFMVRAYGVLRAYSPINRYMPRAIIESMNLDYSSFESELADFRYFINLYASKLSRLNIPGGLAYQIRHMWLYTNIWLDSPMLKSQIYVFNPAFFYVYEEQEEGGGKLVPKPFGTRYMYEEDTDTQVKWTFESLRDYANDLLNRLLKSQDIAIMSGDIAKAYGDRLFNVTMIPEDYMVVGQYNEEVLSQIQNITVMPYSDTFDFEITQEVDVESPNRGALLYNPTFQATAPYGDSRIITIRKDSVAPADTMVATRLTIGTTELEPTDDGKVSMRMDSCGADICLGLNVFHFNSDGEPVISRELDYSLSCKMTTESGSLVSTAFDDFQNASQEISRLEKFDYHPRCLLWLRVPSWSGDNVANAPYKLWLMSDNMDIDNYTKVDNYVLEKMHETALMSMFIF